MAHRLRWLSTTVALGMGAALVVSCPSAPDRPRPDAAVSRATPPPPPKPDPDALPAASGLPPERRAIQVVHGVERLVDVEAARARGLAIVDLGDEWAPYIFQDGVAADGTPLPNRYRTVFVGLANDRTDGDGQPLRPGTKNHLELYGIPPALSVLRERFLAHADRTCLENVDPQRLLAVNEIPTWGITTEKKELARHAKRGEKLEAERTAAGLATLAELGQANPKLAKEIAAHEKFGAERAALAEAEKRLSCEGLLDLTKHVPGLYDTPMRLAMLDFQQRHVVMAQGDITRGTLETLAKPLLANDHAALVRVLTERVMHAGAFLEDGSVVTPGRDGKPPRVPTYLGEDGQRQPVPDLVGQGTQALLERMGVLTPEDALAFFKRHRREDFRWLKVAVRFPQLPPYYGPHMDLVAEIDRGDIWYDFPFDKLGRRLPQPRQKYPAFTLFVRWKGEKVPLVRWRTTIGGWRTELAADGEEYLSYKESDVGPRVWRHVVAAPVWIPPTSSPLGGMVKETWVNGALAKVVNYDEVGPGYLSAYGLVAGIHVDMRKRSTGGYTYFDNGIRTHGSFDYMSLRGRFSHGCHRLYNHLAVRLFSFVLQHRRAKVMGQVALDVRRTFYQPGGVYEMRLPTRGFYYELDPPLPVETLEGEIKGTLQKPIAGYLRKPGVVYASSAPPPVSRGPDSKAGGGGASEAQPAPGAPIEPAVEAPPPMEVAP